jgi:hypothetical protein
MKKKKEHSHLIINIIFKMNEHKMISITLDQCRLWTDVDRALIKPN